MFSLTLHNRLAIQVLEDVLNTAKACIESNFISNFLIIAVNVPCVQYEVVMDMLDFCLIALAYNKESGTGVSHIQLKVVSML